MVILEQVHPGPLLGWIGVFITVTLALGAALALVRGSYNKTRVETYAADLVEARGKIDEMRGTIRDLEQKNERQDETHTLREKALEERATHLEKENESLREMVTQRADVAEVKEVLDNHHREMKTLATKQHKEAMDKFNAMIRVLTLLEKGTA